MNTAHSLYDEISTLKHRLDIVEKKLAEYDNTFVILRRMLERSHVAWFPGCNYMEDCTCVRCVAIEMCQNRNEPSKGKNIADISRSGSDIWSPD